LKVRPTQIRLLRDGKAADAAAAVTGAGTPDPFVDAERLLRHLRRAATLPRRRGARLRRGVGAPRFRPPADSGRVPDLGLSAGFLYC
jgi:hypothetical protein